MSVRLVLTTAAIAALAAGCASSSGAKGGSSGGASSQPAGGSKSVAITVRHDRLTAPDGKTLYYNTVDTKSSIKCVANCASEWPPLAGKAEPGAGLDDEDFATVNRPDGTVQITFYGHPLYEFSGDSGPGQTSGNGLSDEGGHWVVATPEQAEHASSPAPSSSMTSESSGGGSTY